MFQLVFRWELKVICIIEAPSIDIRSLTRSTTDILPHKQCFSKHVEMGSSISVQECNFRVKIQLFKHLISSRLYSIKQFFSTVSNYLIIKRRNVMLVKSWIAYLLEGNPMEGQVLELSAFLIVHQYLINRLDSEERHRKEYSQVRASDDFHIQTEFIVDENLQDFLHFRVVKYAQFDVFSRESVYYSFYFKRQS